MKKSIGILGGMGPLATCNLFRKIIDMSDAKTDQEHARVCIDSNTQIPDRTAFILSSGASPLPQMAKSAVLLESMGAGVILIPCNTAHYLYDELTEFVSVPVVNMIAEAASELKRMGVSKAGLLATSGTIKSGIYNKYMNLQGIELITPGTGEQESITSAIYDCVKASNRNADISGFIRTARGLLDKGAQTLVLGCTEVPIVFEWFNIKLPFIDPMDILAATGLRIAGYNVLRK